MAQNGRQEGAEGLDRGCQVIDFTRVLTRDELKRCLADLHRRAKRTGGARRQLAVFRLATLGLRVSEIAGLRVRDVIEHDGKLFVRVPKAITKGRDGKRRMRLVPAWWDSGAVEDIQRWKQARIAGGAGLDDALIASFKPRTRDRLKRTNVARVWKSAIRCLGPERVRQLSIHCGRHSFVSIALAAGRSLAEVRDAAGHSNVSTTEVYLHCIQREGVPDIFS